ncbi:hypothetical protein HanPI659440_Chr15g0598201 [Helianthus annuus]|nr:hypothetical protein HanPI659440_Chr15g0598201 [Helianthus annuus]
MKRIADRERRQRKREKQRAAAKPFFRQPFAGDGDAEDGVSTVMAMVVLDSSSQQMSGGSGHPPSRSLFGQCIIDDLGSAFFVLTEFNWWCSKSNLQMRVWCRSGGGGRVEVAAGEGRRWCRSGGGSR